MPLSSQTPRKPIHDRVIRMSAYQREDGLFDIESHLVDTKPMSVQRIMALEPSPPGAHLHDLLIRLTLNEAFVIQAIEASSDTTPYTICKNAESSLSVLIGEQVGKGWSRLVKGKLRGTLSCTHLMEMLIPMATTAFQGIKGLRFSASLERKAEPIPELINSCYAFADHREVVMKIWPEKYKQNQSMP